MLEWVSALNAWKDKQLEEWQAQPDWGARGVGGESAVFMRRVVARHDGCAALALRANYVWPFRRLHVVFANGAHGLGG